MDKSVILGGFVDEIGENIKQGAKTAVEQTTGTGEYAKNKTQQQNPDIENLKAQDAEQTKKKLAQVRSGLDVMREGQRPSSPRPRERVEIQQQEEAQLKKEKEAKNPPPLAVASKKGTKELMGVSG